MKHHEQIEHRYAPREKRCSKCKLVKPLSEYHKHSGAPDGLRYMCKLCRKKDAAEYYVKDPEARRRASKRYKDMYPESHRRSEARYRKRNPLKIKAHNDVTHAIERGELVRLPCEKCGNSRSEAHHENYLKPLDVIWLCRVCHVEVHKEKEDAS